ncbi:MAG: hypothetical protein OQL16_12375 [Gammaproteobacteria bacterium]|nr:hypothetical protein [Gammaproteobacteria bacterium]
MSKLIVVFNGTPELEYDRSKPLEAQQLLYLDKMDEKMSAGISIGDQQVDNPDDNQRSQFVAANLAHAIKTNHEASMASLCAYLATRMPDIQQVTIDERNDGMEIDFNFEPANNDVVLVAPPTKLN